MPAAAKKKIMDQKFQKTLLVSWGKKKNTSATQFYMIGPST